MTRRHVAATGVWAAALLIAATSGPVAAQTLVSGRYLSTAPTIANGGQHPLTLTVDGRLRTDAAGASGGTVAIDQTTPGTTNAVVAIGNVASGATDSGNPLKIGGVFTTSPPTITTGQRGDAQLDANANFRVRLVGSTLTGADAVANTALAAVANAGGYSTLSLSVAPIVFNGTTWDRLRGNTSGVNAIPTASTGAGASFLNVVAGQATTVVKSGAGTLYAIVLNSAATATNVTTVYDNTAGSGTVIAIPAVTTATIPVTLSFGTTGLAFATGLTVVTATANGGNMTFIYK
jgi:hypothetical protein